MDTAASGSGKAPLPVVKHEPDDGDVILRKRKEVDRCAGAHGVPPLGTKVQILIGRDGRPRSVAIEPGSVGETQIGACIRKVFEATRFSPGDERDIAVKLRQPV
jgi:hypothetical protein